MSQLVGCIAGVVNGRDVAISGSYAYVASNEFGLAIIDISNPNYLRPKGVAKPAFYAEKVAADGTIAILAGNAGGLYVVDTTTKTAPVTTGHLTGTVKHVAISGTTGYMIEVVPGNPAHVYVQIVDLSNVNTPVRKGRVDVGAATSVMGIRVLGSRVFVTNATSVLAIDVSNVNSPSIISTISTRRNQPKDIDVSGTTLYVADTDSVLVIDISTITSPVIRGSVATGAARRISYANGLVGVLDGNNFSIIDVSNPTAPTITYTGSNFLAQGIALITDNMFFAAPGSGQGTNKQGGLLSMNLEVPSSPWLADEVYGEFDNFGVAVSSGLAIAAVAGNQFGLGIFNVSDSANPFYLGNLSYGLPLGTSFKAVCMDDDRVYALMVTPGNPARLELVVVSIATPGTPTIQGRCTLTGSPAEFATLKTGFVAVAAGTKLSIIDVATPAAPALEGSLSLSGANSVALATDKAFVVGGNNIYAINTSNLTAPSLTSTLACTGATKCFLGSSNRLYVIAANTLKIIDVANPAAMILRSTTTILTAQAVASVGTTVFVACPSLTHLEGTGGVRVVDATSATAPIVGSLIIIPGTCRSIIAENGIIYAGDSAGQISIIEV